MDAELLVPLADLPGFDPTGLRVLFGESRGAVVLVHHPGVGDGPWCDVWHLGLHKAFQTSTEALTLDLADAATRDRLARFVAARVGLECGATAPAWVRVNGAPWPVWNLANGPRDWIVCSAQDPVAGGLTAPTCKVVVALALAALDPASTDRCADGCRHVDAVALGIVARFVAEVQRA